MSDQLNRTNESRRQFLKNSAAVAGGVWMVGPTVKAETRSANEKLNIACIGVGGRGSANVGGVSSENIIAMCDVDESKAGKQLSTEM